MLRWELQEAKASVGGRCAEIEASALEWENKLKEELGVLRNQLVGKDSHIKMMTMRMRPSGPLQCRHAMYRQASAYYVDEFATCLAQFKNIGNLPPRFDLSFVNVRADGFGNIDGGGPSV
ncbi:hypothetical protein Salat_2546000 [Sesamum alatum]|uniref:Uncharacterized protein n=1 Tax=Sesamum alatum TaxID=300844 RepID=A0AAE1XSE6_9LAMI|nr:hypothetical protein Salat_2546000 [Sesamum alatum]